MKLSICTITYNHGRYIRQALESFLNQVTTFNFEILISDDCSTDDTVELIKPYVQQYPDKIRLITHDHNIGMIPNFKEAIDGCKGEYVALCEGDDYWIEPTKLQRQVDLLDQYPEYSICFHKARLLFDGIDPFPFEDINAATKEVSIFDDLVKGNFLHTPTVVYRNHLFGKYPEYLLGYKFGDWPLHLLNAEKGNIIFIPEEWAVYRITASGAWSAKGRRHKINYTIQYLQSIRRNFSTSHLHSFNSSIRNYYKYLLKLDLKENAYTDAYKTMLRFVKFLITNS